MGTYFYKFKVAADYDTVFDAIVKVGKEIGEIKSSYLKREEIEFRSGMNFKKLRDPIKYNIKFEVPENEDIVASLIINVYQGAFGEKLADKVFVEFRELLNHHLDSPVVVIHAFNVTQKIEGYLEINEDERKIYIPYRKNGSFNSKVNQLTNNGKLRIFNYEEILNFELLEDGETLSSGGLIRSAVGAITLGAPGAVVGAITGTKRSKQICTSLSLKITINNQDNPIEYIEFIKSPTKKNGIFYKTEFAKAHKCAAMIDIICSDVKKKMDSAGSNSNGALLSGADEILKFKNLLDAGIITKEEFELKKKQLLDL